MGNSTSIIVTTFIVLAAHLFLSLGTLLSSEASTENWEQLYFAVYVACMVYIVSMVVAWRASKIRKLAVDERYFLREQAVRAELLLTSALPQVCILLTKLS